jgi:hypothetical protein
MSNTLSPLLLLSSIALALPASGQEPDSKVPPAGPPWTKDFFAARAQALETGKPIFLYSTKTY